MSMASEGRGSCVQGPCVVQEGDSSSDDGDDSMEIDLSNHIDVSLELKVLDCPVCHHPLSPPIFQCGEGHCVCSSCRDKLPGKKNKCHSCSARRPLARCRDMERVVQSVRVPCLHAEHGCTEKMAYHELEAHERSCQHAPCLCPDPGCGFTGTTAALLDHLTYHHKWPTTDLSYNKKLGICVQPGPQALRAQDGRLFVVNMVEMERKTRGESEAEHLGDSSGKRTIVSVGTDVLDCASCYDPLKPPIFQRREGHCICCSCGDTQDRRDGNVCSAKSRLTRCFAMEQFVKSVLVLRCCNAKYGCTESMLNYEDMDTHRYDHCPYWSCVCPEHNCGFEGTSAMLLDHFVSYHKWPSTEFRYGETFDIHIQPGLQVLHAPDGHLFVTNMVSPPGEPFGYGVALVRVGDETLCSLECGVCFSYSGPGRHPQVSSRDVVRGSLFHSGPPTYYSFVVPWPWKSNRESPGMLKINIQAPGEELEEHL